MASEWLDARVGRAGAMGRFANTPDGVARLAAFCREHRVELVAMEATGGYERLPFGLLWAEGVPAAVVNPRAVRRFAEGVGVLEKTDRLDAGLIARYAEVKRVAPRPPAGEAQRKLVALVRRLRQLTAALVAQRNQRRLVSDPDVLASVAAVAGALKAEVRAFEAKIAALIEADPLWRELDAAFRAVEGVAGRTVARLMAEMPEIGTLSGKAAASGIALAMPMLAGLAPIARDSGKQQGKRRVRGGREGVRSILYVVAEVVRRHEPDFRAFHARLTAAGKPKKAIRVALAHKLLTRLNAKARDVRAQLERGQAAPQPA